MVRDARLVEFQFVLKTLQTQYGDAPWRFVLAVMAWFSGCTVSCGDKNPLWMSGFS
jgi:hypothetical protein